MSNIKLTFDEVCIPESYKCHAKYSITEKSSSTSKYNFTTFYVILLIQVASTCLMLLALPFTLQAIAAETEFNSSFSSANSGIYEAENIRSDLIDFILLRIKRRLSQKKQTYILTRKQIESICFKENNFISRFKSLSNFRLQYCDIFDVLSIIYAFLFSKSDLVSMSKNITFPLFDFSISVNDQFINQIPSQLLTMKHSGNILASNVSVQSLIYKHFSTSENCASLLTRVYNRDKYVLDKTVLFAKTIQKNNCIRFMTKENLSNSSFLKQMCQRCELTYKNWLCTHSFDTYMSVILPEFPRSPKGPDVKHSKKSSSATQHRFNAQRQLSQPPSATLSSSLSASLSSYSSDSLKSSSSISSSTLIITSTSRSALIGVKSCPTWCSEVETVCPYFTPVDTNGGEPAFLCDESHYHHSARYKMNDQTHCGADLPWNFCCYSQELLEDLQRQREMGLFHHQLLPNVITVSATSRMIKNRTGGGIPQMTCSDEQKKCMLDLISSIYEVMERQKLILKEQQKQQQNSDDSTGSISTSTSSSTSTNPSDSSRRMELISNSTQQLQRRSSVSSRNSASTVLMIKYNRGGSSRGRSRHLCELFKLIFIFMLSRTASLNCNSVFLYLYIFYLCLFVVT